MSLICWKITVGCFSLQSIHVYWASVILLPQSVIKDINKVLKGFLWNQNEVSKGKAKVAWKNICKPKQQGGLGLKDLGVWNKAMIVKHLWHIVTDKDSLWVKWINTVKLKGRRVWKVNEDVTDSWGCWNILNLIPEVESFITMKIGDGAKIDVWFDNWSEIGALNDLLSYRELYNARLSARMKLKDMVLNGNWKWHVEWETKFHMITQIPKCSLDENKRDEVVWKGRQGKRGDFSVKQAYRDLKNEEENVIWSKLVWYSQNIPKHAFVLWLAIQNNS